MTDEELVERLCDLGIRSAELAAGRIKQLTAERDRLALAICGGEDAPGYANAQTVETLEHVAKQNQQSHGETINSLLAAEAERARLREAAIALRDDMLERSRAGMDVIRGEQYRIVNAGAGVWMDFCAALKGETP